MKFSINTEKIFKPVEVTIKLESEEEVKEFYLRMEIWNKELYKTLKDSTRAWNIPYLDTICDSDSILRLTELKEALKRVI